MISVCDLLFTENLINFDPENNIIKVSNLYLMLYNKPVIAFINREDADYYNIDVELKYYTTENLSIVVTSHPEFIIIEDATFSRLHNKYIPTSKSVYSEYLSDFIYEQDAIYSKFLKSFIFSRDAKMAWDNEAKAYDWIPPELTVEVYQNGHYRTLIKSQVYEKNGTWFYKSNDEVVW